MNTYPITIRVYENNPGGDSVERYAYGQMVEQGRTMKVLICEPIPGMRASRYLLVNWCDRHQIGWKGAACPLCGGEPVKDAPGKRTRNILASGAWNESENIEQGENG